MPTPLTGVDNVLAFKQETTIGTAVAVTNADAGFRAYDVNLKLVSDADKIPAQAGLGYENAVMKAEHSELTFKTRVAGKGSAALPFWMLQLLPCCGMSIASLLASCTSDTSTWKSGTGLHYQNGRSKTGRGMMGNPKLTAKAGEVGIIEWNFMGGSNGDPVDATILSGMSYDAVKPPIFQGANSFLIAGSATFQIETATIDWGNKVALTPDPNANRGYAAAWIGNRTPIITFDPLAQLFATKNWYAIAQANTSMSFSLVFNGGANNTITFAGTIQQDKNPEDQDRDGKIVDALGFQINADSLTVTQS